MSITITTTRETDHILLDIGKHSIKHQKALRLALNEIGSELVNKIANYIFRPPKTGRIYIFRGRKHQASAPGQSPANRTGRLARSIDYKVRSYSEMVFGAKAFYGGYLEHGTHNDDGSWRIQPRPYIIRGFNAVKKNLIRSILENIDRELKA